MKKNIEYMYACEKHQKSMKLFGQATTDYTTDGPIRDLPRSQWFLAAYVRDVFHRLDMIKASLSSTFGRILKIDSTRKITKKLAGIGKNQAHWVTNVGNEYGSILSSVVTVSESSDDLELMATSIVDRYKTTNVTEPIILYADRDCCSARGNSKYHQLFKAWKNLRVCLDIWHYIRWFTDTSDSHPLYGVFLKQLSGCIFEWDRRDFNRLMDAKRGELKIGGVVNPTIQAIKKQIKKG